MTSRVFGMRIEVSIKGETVTSRIERERRRGSKGGREGGRERERERLTPYIEMIQQASLPSLLFLLNRLGHGIAVNVCIP